MIHFMDVIGMLLYRFQWMTRCRWQRIIVFCIDFYFSIVNSVCFFVIFGTIVLSSVVASLVQQLFSSLHGLELRLSTDDKSIDSTWFTSFNCVWMRISMQTKTTTRLRLTKTRLRKTEIEKELQRSEKEVKMYCKYVNMVLFNGFCRPLERFPYQIDNG